MSESYDFGGFDEAYLEEAMAKPTRKKESVPERLHRQSDDVLDFFKRNIGKDVETLDIREACKVENVTNAISNLRRVRGVQIVEGLGIGPRGTQLYRLETTVLKAAEVKTLGIRIVESSLRSEWHIDNNTLFSGTEGGTLSKAECEEILAAAKQAYIRILARHERVVDGGWMDTLSTLRK